jgi:SAM-dependent methyltransferase
MNFWDTRYSSSEFAYGKEPNDFLRQNIAQIPKGRVLCLAEGEGRNGVFLAKHGFSVHAVDLSPIGLEKAMAYAAAEGVEITTETADLGLLTIHPSSWSGIISISAHMPSSARKKLHRQVVAGLKVGGVFILEAYTRRQLEIGGIGGPSSSQLDFFMSLEELRLELDGLNFIHAKELDREVNEGEFHRGTSAVVQIIARKIT